MTRRVAIVDDDDISRRGVAELLREHPDVSVVAVMTHDEALQAEVSWDGVDVVLVDAADPRRTDDQFPGVAVVSAVRAQAAPGVTIVVLTGHYLDDALRTRMREARADFFVYRDEIQSVDRLHELVMRPPPQHAGVPAPLDPEALRRRGISSSTRVNEGVAFLRSRGRFAQGGRRAATRMRRDFNDAARLTPTNRDGSMPDREQDSPGTPQIDRFWEWATRAKRR